MDICNFDLETLVQEVDKASATNLIHRKIEIQYQQQDKYNTL